MSTNSPQLAAALLCFLSSFRPVHEIKSWTDLRDGQVLWQILTTVAPAFFTGILPKCPPAENWIERWQNLKHIHRMVMAYIRDECGKLEEWTKAANPDLKAIALDAPEKDCIEFVKAVVIATVYSPEANQRVVNVMEKLGPKVSRPIASCIEQTIALDKSIKASLLSQVSASPRKQTFMKHETELQDEQQLIEAFEKISKLEIEKTELSKTLRESQRQKTEFQSSLQNLTQQLEFGDGTESQTTTVDRLLQTLEQDKDHITILERELLELRETKVSQVKQLEDLLEAQESKRRLTDEIQLLRAERDELVQKDNINENLRRKIITLQETVGVGEKIRQEHEAAQEELITLRRTRDRYLTLQDIHAKTLEFIQNSEKVIQDELASRQVLERTIEKLTDSLEVAKTQRILDVNHLEDIIKDLESNQEANIARSLNLDCELGDMDASNDLKSENERLKAELSRWRANHDLRGIDESEVTSEDTLDDEETKTADDTNNKILQLIQEGENALQQDSTESTDHRIDGRNKDSSSSDSDTSSIKSSQSRLSLQATSRVAKDFDVTNNICREIRLMTSAWYDITRRIQSDAVIVQRRRDTPKSFLNRQRRLVLGVGTGINTSNPLPRT